MTRTPLLTAEDLTTEAPLAEIDLSTDKILADEEPVVQKTAVNWRVSLTAVSYETPGNYCMSLWCPCVRFAQTATRAKLAPRCFGPIAWTCVYFSAFTLFCMPFLWPWCPPDPRRLALPWCGVWWIALPLIAVIGAIKRSEIRRKYNIRSDCGPLEDCCVHTFCEPCAIAQEAAHVDLEENFQSSKDIVIATAIDDVSSIHDKVLNSLCLRPVGPTIMTR